MPDPCPLCPPTRGVIADNAHWTLVLNENQATLGRVFFALKRHETDVTALSPPEIAALWTFAAQTKRALDTLFAPDHFNYLFHMNLTPHVHMHIYPRYVLPREFGGETFPDTRFGEHYDPQETRPVSPTTARALALALQGALMPGGDAAP